MQGTQGMFRTHVVKYGFLVLIFSALVACGAGDDKPEASDPGFSPAPGLGDSGATPTGQPFTFPQGVTVNTAAGALHPTGANGQKDLTQPQCGTFTAATVEVVNLAHGFVDLCVELVNTGAATSVTLPGGLTFISQDVRVQNGMLAQSVTINVPSGSKWVLLRLNCLNQTYPGADGQQYQVGPISNYAPLQEIVSIISNKQIDPADTWTVQSAVWHVTDSPAGLTQEDRNALNAM